VVKIGIIGGSGLDDPEILLDPKEIEVDTPYGRPTSPLSVGTIHGKMVVLVSRHGKKHQNSPSEINFRANIFALKKQGVTHILATTACGSLKAGIGKGDFVIIDQFIDFTRLRKNTFWESFEKGTNHSPMADPFDATLRKILHDSAIEL